MNYRSSFALNASWDSHSADRAGASGQYSGQQQRFARRIDASDPDWAGSSVPVTLSDGFSFGSMYGTAAPPTSPLSNFCFLTSWTFSPAGAAAAADRRAVLEIRIQLGAGGNGAQFFPDQIQPAGCAWPERLPVAAPAAAYVARVKGEVLALRSGFLSGAGSGSTGAAASVLCAMAQSVPAVDPAGVPGVSAAERRGYFLFLGAVLADLWLMQLAGLGRAQAVDAVRAHDRLVGDNLAVFEKVCEAVAAAERE